MKILLVSIALLLACSAFATSEPAKLYYFENVANNPQKIVFKVDKYCPTEKSAVRIQDFYSQKEYPSTNDGKNATVRVAHIYATSTIKNCKKAETKKHEVVLEIPTKKLMTHVYVTTDPNITVESVQ